MMQIEIWSDVVCPFCYIGKRHLEQAIADLKMEDEVEITWKSFQLDPSAQPREGLTLKKYLSESKGMSMDQVEQMTTGVVDRAAAVGLKFNFDEAIVANTIDAHRLLHLASEKGKQGEMKERLLLAYFTENKNLNDKEQLADLAMEVGLDRNEALRVLTTNAYASEFRKDVQEARQIGIQGVPFFVINRKYVVSGAQPIDTFKQALQQVNTEMQEDASCAVDGQNC